MLAVVQNLSYWSLFTFRDYDKVKPYTFSELQRITGISQTPIVVFLVNQQDLRSLDLMVNQLFRSDSNILLNSILYLADNTSVAQCTRTESKVIENLNKGHKDIYTE